jgi:SulP family sulfate permease
MLEGLYGDLAAAGIQFRLLEAHAAVRDILRDEAFEECLGQISRRMSVDDIIQAFHCRTEPCAQAT